MGSNPTSTAKNLHEVSGGVVGPAGQIVNSPRHGGVGVSFGGVRLPLGNLPAVCQRLIFDSPVKFGSCLAARGYRLVVSYQPAGRYWAFQGTETGVFLFLAVILIAVTAIVVICRDA